MIDLYAWRKADLKRIDALIADWRRQEGWQIVKWLRNNATIESMYGYGMDCIVCRMEKATLQKIRKCAKMAANREQFNSQGITQDMIDRARSHPIENLFPDARRGIVKCFIHEDKRPSATISKGKFKCFVCNEKPLDSIGVLMRRDGCTFVEAVMRLQ